MWPGPSPGVISDARGDLTTIFDLRGARTDNLPIRSQVRWPLDHRLNLAVSPWSELQTSSKPIYRYFYTGSKVIGNLNLRMRNVNSYHTIFLRMRAICHMKPTTSIREFVKRIICFAYALSLSRFPLDFSNCQNMKGDFDIFPIKEAISTTTNDAF